MFLKRAVVLIPIAALAGGVDGAWADGALRARADGALRARADGAVGYPWRSGPAENGTIAERFAPPEGFRRIAAKPGGYADWLRHLPLKPRGAPVRLHNGQLKGLQNVHAAVVDIDTGRRDLQQCADAVMRLRAEYLYARRRFRDIHFNFTSGDRAEYNRWADGWRPRVRGNKVTWRQTRAPAKDRKTFRSYMRVVFTYAGSYSLRKELRPVKKIRDMRIGDIFIQGGFPGHAVSVVDMAENPRTGERAFLLTQSYMPAQDMHVLKNPGDASRDSGGGAWYPVSFGAILETPEWRFRSGDLHRFRERAS